MINLYLPYGLKKNIQDKNIKKKLNQGGSGLALVALLSLEKNFS